MTKKSKVEARFQVQIEINVYFNFIDPFQEGKNINLKVVLVNQGMLFTLS